MNDKLPLPQEVILAYPLLTDDSMKYAGGFTPDIPAVPDRIYDLYKSVNAEKMIAHIAADYPDPARDSKELQDISGYEFINIVVPGVQDKHVDIVDSDDMNDDFFTKVGDTYHYVANIYKTRT